MGARLPMIHHVSRVLLQLLMSAGCGLLLGAVAGSIIPFAGTLVGAVSGGLTGAVFGVFVVPLVYRRDLTKAWLRLLLVPGVYCFACALLGWLTFLSAAGSGSGVLYRMLSGIDLGWVMSGSFFGSLLLYFGTAVWCYVRLPAVWPPTPEGHCVSCGYSLRGLTVVVCPECGEPPEESAAGATCPSCNYSLVGLDTSVCPECGVDYEAECAGV